MLTWEGEKRRAVDGGRIREREREREGGGEGEREVKGMRAL